MATRTGLTSVRASVIDGSMPVCIRASPNNLKLVPYAIVDFVEWALKEFVKS